MLKCVCGIECKAKHEYGLLVIRHSHDNEICKLSNKIDSDIVEIHQISSIIEAITIHRDFNLFQCYMANAYKHLELFERVADILALHIANCNDINKVYKITDYLFTRLPKVEHEQKLVTSFLNVFGNSFKEPLMMIKYKSKDVKNIDLLWSSYINSINYKHSKLKQTQQDKSKKYFKFPDISNQIVEVNEKNEPAPNQHSKITNSIVELMAMQSKEDEKALKNAMRKFINNQNYI